MEGNNMTQLTDGMRVSYYHHNVHRVGTMTGTIEADDGLMLFVPDEGFNDALYEEHGVEGESGLYLTGADVAPL